MYWPNLWDSFERKFSKKCPISWNTTVEFTVYGGLTNAGRILGEMDMNVVERSACLFSGFNSCSGLGFMSFPRGLIVEYV